MNVSNSCTIMVASYPHIYLTHHKISYLASKCEWSHSNKPKRKPKGVGLVNDLVAFKQFQRTHHNTTHLK